MKQTEIDRMTVTKKLQIIESLWDTLDNDTIESPAWHAEVLKERKKAIDSGSAKFISLDALKKILLLMGCDEIVLLEEATQDHRH